MNASLTKKLALALLAGFAFFGIGFFIANGYVTATNAIAVAAGATTPPYDPAWAYPMLTGITFFTIPVAAIFAKDLSQEENSVKQ